MNISCLDAIGILTEERSVGRRRYRKSDWEYNQAAAIVCYLMNIERETGKKVLFSRKRIRRDFRAYKSIEEAAEIYGMTVEELMNRKDVLRIKDNTIVMKDTPLIIAKNKCTVEWLKSKGIDGEVVRIDDQGHPTKDIDMYERTIISDTFLYPLSHNENASIVHTHGLRQEDDHKDITPEDMERMGTEILSISFCNEENIKFTGAKVVDEDSYRHLRRLKHYNLVIDSCYLKVEYASGHFLYLCQGSRFGLEDTE